MANDMRNTEIDNPGFKNYYKQSSVLSKYMIYK